jgi:hypothetical protein
MTGYHEIRGGRYKCDFCDHTSYKTYAGISAHLQAHHAKELNEVLANELAKTMADLHKERIKPPKVVEKVVTKERVVYRDKPEPKYWYTKTVGIAGIYCTACKLVQLNPGIPTGQTIENTPHQCGNRTLLPVVEVR